MSCGTEGLPDEVSFGPFRLAVRERKLLKNGRSIPLGGRALDLLMVLVANAGQPVGKQALISQVWPNVIVGQGSLRFQAVALRKALGEGEDEARYIATVPGRGYCFVAEVSPIASSSAAELDQTSIPRHRLPARLGRIVGREGAMQAIVARLLAERFVTTTGPGGVGKTALAVALAHQLLDEFAGEACLVDLGPVGDPALAVDTVASALGLAVRTADTNAGVVAFLRGRRRLLLLDSCEHVIDGIAALAEQIHREAPQTYILATSREALRVEGERVYRLASLEAPVEREELTAAAALTIPAVQLFVERVPGSDGPYELSDDHAPAVASICRTLDGMPLAIELAAGRAGLYGVLETARLLSEHVPLSWRGRRTAPPRHQTLAATLDWSHALLLNVERVVLRRLAVFVGGFGLEAAQAVADEAVPPGADVLGAVAGLVAKSLLVARPSVEGISYRLLDTTRAYAVDKLVASGEFEEIARRHAAYFRDRLPRGKHKLGGSADRDEIANVRTALRRCFGATGDADIGAELAAAAAPLFLRLSLLTECIRWMECALATLDAQRLGTRAEMELQASLGVSLMLTDGNSERVLAALERGLAIAEQLGELDRQVRLLGWLNVLHLRMGRHRTALVYGQRGAVAAARQGDPDAIAATDGLVGLNYSLLGRNAEALTLLTASLARGAPVGGAVRLGWGTRSHTMISYALTLWVVGKPDRAMAVALETIEEAVQLDHPTTLCIALLYAVSFFLWMGDLDRAELHVEQFIAQATRHSLTPYQVSGAGIRGEIAIRRGQAEAGVAILRATLDGLQRDRYQRRIVAVSCAMAEGLASMRRGDEALRTIDAAIERAEHHGDLVAMPEMLRIKGEIIADLPEGGPGAGEAMLLRSLDLARAQEALSWELRAAMSLARLWSGQGRRGEASKLLTSVYDRFTEGFATADLAAAARLLNEVIDPSS